MLKITKLLLVFLFFTIISLFSVLLSGIKIDSFSFGNIYVSQFYIKLDKKLIVDIDYIEIKSKKSKVENSYDDLKKNIDYLPNILKFFNKIHVERLVIDGNEFTIELNDKALYLDNKFINISSKINFLSQEVVFDLYSLYLKDVKLMFDGQLKVDYFNNELHHFGKYYYKDIEGDIKLEMTEKLAQFYLNSNSFKSLKFLKKFFRLSTEAEAWMYDNVKGNIKLEEFYGKVDLVKKEVILKSLQGKATIDKAKIKYHKDLKTVNTKRIDVNYKKDTLSFNLIKPTYDGVKLDGSNVVINHLTSEKKGNVLVNIKAKTKLDKRILDILNAYDVNLPLVQKTGITNASLSLKIPYSASRKMITKGKFIVKNANININDNFEFFTKKANVTLNNSIVSIKNSHFKHKKMLDSYINLDIDTKTLKASGDALIHSFIIENEDVKIINIKSKKTPLELDFNNDTNINLSNISTNIRISDYIYVDISDLSSIYNSSQLLKDISVKSGNLSLKIKDENNIFFNGRVSGLDFPLEKDNKKIKTLDIKGSIQGKYTNVSSKDNDIKVDIKNDDILIHLKNLDIVLKDDKSKEKEIPSFKVIGENLRVKLSNKTYYTSKASATLSGNKITFIADVYNLDLPIQKNNKKVKSLSLIGEVIDENVSIRTKDNKIIFKYLENKKLDIILDGYDLDYNTRKEKKEEDLEFNLKAKNSSIFLNNKYKFLADDYEIRVRKNSIFFHLAHDKTDITFKKSKDGKIDLFANDVSDKFLNTAFDKHIFEGGKLMLLANGINTELKGKLLLTNVKIDDLAILNNLLLFIHSSPALVNPLLAIPSVVGMASTGGFNLTGYKVIDGVLEFRYDEEANILNIDKMLTLGNGIDFEGKGKVDINTQEIDADVKMIFFKDYSKIVGAIPVVNYVLLGKNKRVSTQVKIFGPLNNPKLSTNLTKDAFSVPLNIGKRILQSPIKLFEFIKNQKPKKEE